MVDWDNMPCGSMVSFSRVGAKPYWEDPMHRQGGRWIIREFSHRESEVGCSSTFSQCILDEFSAFVAIGSVR